MRQRKIPKRGGFRRIWIPSSREKQFLRDMLETIPSPPQHVAKNVFGFMKFKSCVSNALHHKGARSVLTFDLSDFFDTVKDSHLSKWKTSILDVFHKRFKSKVPICAQGLPTSPAISNLAAIPLDEALMKYCKKKGFKYSRYADDITLSSHDAAITPQEAFKYILKDVRDIVHRCGFKLNERKTKFFQLSKGQVAEITGVLLHPDGHISGRKHQRKRLRALKHKQLKGQYVSCHYFPGDPIPFLRDEVVDYSAQIVGLERWLSMTPPLTEKQILQREARVKIGKAFDIAQYYGLKQLDKIKPLYNGFIIFDEILGYTKKGYPVRLTNDPLRIMFMSSQGFLTPWTSCMDLAKRGCYSQGMSAYLAFIAQGGLLLAYVEDSRISTKKFGRLKLSMTKMKARTLVYVTRSNDMYRSHWYYPTQHCMHPIISDLRYYGLEGADELLQKKGIRSSARLVPDDMEFKTAFTVKGYAPRECPYPYIDIGYVKVVRLVDKQAGTRREALSARLSMGHGDPDTNAEEVEE